MKCVVVLIWIFSNWFNYFGILSLCVCVFLLLIEKVCINGNINGENSCCFDFDIDVSIGG